MDIEEYFEPRGFFYDRRKNHHKNQGRTKDQIVSIPNLAQAVMAMLLQEPNNSRGRPSTLIKDDQDYARVFSVTYPLEMYCKCARFMKAVDDFIRLQDSDDIQMHRNNIRFHLAMVAGAMKTGHLCPRPSDICGMTFDSEGDQLLLQKCLGVVWEEFQRLSNGREFRGDANRLAKSASFDNALKARLEEALRPTTE